MKSKNTIITIIVLIILAGIAYAISNKKNDDNIIIKDEKTQITENESMMMKDDSTMTASTSDSSMMTVKGGVYEVYSPEKLANAESGDVVLFFNADWCPTCRTVDADIKSNLTSVPKNLTILDVDYDTNSDLKKKYGVTYQHTFVQVDKDGNLIKKWSGGSTLISVIKEII